MIKKICFIIFITTLAYLNIFWNNSVIDDHVFIGKYHPSLVESFKGNVPAGHEGVYRPIRGVIYNLYYSLWGDNLNYYHASAIATHLISTILVFFIATSLSDLVLFPFIAALLFGLHPIHTETITYMTSSIDSLGLMFFLGSFYLYLKNYFNFSLFLAVLAFFTSEMTLTLPIIIAFYNWIYKNPTHSKRKYLTISTLFVSIYFMIRFFVLDITTRGPYLANSFYLTMITMSKVIMQYIAVLFWPFNLQSNHIISPGIEAFVYRNYQTLAISSQSLMDLEILLSITIIFCLIYAIFKYHTKYPLITFMISWFFITLLPVMDFVPQGSIMNERSLYLASIGYIVILAILISYLISIHKLLGMVLLCIVSTTYLYQTIHRNTDWQTDITIWQADISKYPKENAYAYYSLGNAYNDQGQYHKAISAYHLATQINPGMAVAWASLGRTYNEMGDTNTAIQYYQQALTIDPNFWEVKHNLQNIYNRL